MSERKEQKGELVGILDLGKEILTLIGKFRQRNLPPIGKVAMEDIERLVKNREKMIETLKKVLKTSCKMRSEMEDDEEFKQFSGKISLELHTIHTDLKMLFDYFEARDKLNTVFLDRTLVREERKTKEVMKDE